MTDEWELPLVSEVFGWLLLPPLGALIGCASVGLVIHVVTWGKWRGFSDATLAFLAAFVALGGVTGIVTACLRIGWGSLLPMCLVLCVLAFQMAAGCAKAWQEAKEMTREARKRPDNPNSKDYRGDLNGESKKKD